MRFGGGAGKGQSLQLGRELRGRPALVWARMPVPIGPSSAGPPTHGPTDRRFLRPIPPVLPSLPLLSLPTTAAAASRHPPTPPAAPAGSRFLPRQAAIGPVRVARSPAPALPGGPVSRRRAWRLPSLAGDFPPPPAVRGSGWGSRRAPRATARSSASSTSGGGSRRARSSTRSSSSTPPTAPSCSSSPSSGSARGSSLSQGRLLRPPSLTLAVAG